MSSPTSDRPSQVTIAGWSVMGASAVVLLAVFQTMGTLNTLDMRDRVATLIGADSSPSTLGIDVDRALEVLRWGLFAAAIAAVASGVLGYYAMQRQQVARIVVSAAAFPILFVGPVIGSLPAIVVAVGAAMLWTRPARDWFAGRPITQPDRRPRAREGAEPADRPAPPAVPPVVPPPSGADAGGQPPPTAGWGAPAAGGLPGVAPAWPPTGVAPAGGGGAAAQSGPRPRQVRTACLIAWVFSGITIVVALTGLAGILANQQQAIDAVLDHDLWDDRFDESLIIPVIVLYVVVAVLWSAAACVFALFAWRGQSWAWLALTISAGCAAPVTVLAMPYALAHTAAIGLTLGLLLSKPARAWFATRRPPPPGPPPGPWPGGGPGGYPPR